MWPILRNLTPKAQGNKLYLFQPRLNHSPMQVGRVLWLRLLVAIGGYWWLLVAIGGYWWQHFCQMQYLRAARIYLGCRNLQNSMYQGGMSEQRSWMRDTERQWATGILLGAPEVGHLQSWNVRHELPSGMKWNFWERMRINFVPHQCFQNFEGENAMISRKKLKHSTLRRSPCHWQWEELLGKQYYKPMEGSFQCNSKFCWLHW